MHANIPHSDFFDENNNGSPAEFDIYTPTCGASDVMPNHRQRGKGPLLLHPGEGIEEEEEEVEGDRPRRFYHPSRRRRRRRRKGPRIVGGEGAEEGAWPWQVKKYTIINIQSLWIFSLNHAFLYACGTV